MKKMKNAFIPDCLQAQHTRMSSQTVYGIQTIQNEIYCNSSEDYTIVSSEQSEILHQRCSSKSSGTSSVDTFTLKARMENLEIALTMLRENFQRMEQAMSKQIEKAIDIIITTTNAKEMKDIPEDIFPGVKEKYIMKNENKKLMKAVKFLTESSRIMRNALSEHTEVINHLTYVINQPTETTSHIGQGRNESPVEKIINKCKKQKDKIHIVYPKPINPLDVSEYLAVEHSTTTQPPCCYCKTSNMTSDLNNLVWEMDQGSHYCHTNFSIDKNTNVQCNCHICSLNMNVLDPDGDYVTLLKDYIAIGQCNQAFQYYNKSSLPDVTTHCNVNTDLDDENLMFNEKKGTLV